MAQRRYSHLWKPVAGQHTALLILGIIIASLIGLIIWGWNGYGGIFSLNETDTSKNLNDAIQHIQSSEVVTGTSTTAIIFDLRYPARARVEFGLTNQLTNIVELDGVRSSYLAKIFGLTPNTQYYYRVVVDDQQSQGRLASSLRSFTTGEASQKLAVDPTKSDFWIVPSPSKKQATIVSVLRDQDGLVITGGEPTFSPTRGTVDISQPTVTGGIAFADVTSGLDSRQAVNVSLLSQGAKIASGTVVFDPSYTEPTAAANAGATSLPWTSTVAILTFALVALLLFAGWGLVKLARAK